MIRIDGGQFRGRTPVVCNVEAVGEHVELIGSELVSEIDGVVMVTCGVQRPAIRWGRPVIALEMAAPTSAQRVELWKAELGQGSLEDAEFLATQYPLAPAVIHHAAEAAKARAGERPLPRGHLRGHPHRARRPARRLRQARDGDPDLGRPRAAG